MTGLDRLSPQQAVAEMVAAGATFTTSERRDSLAPLFVYNVKPGGDRGRCRAIMAAVKERPTPFFAAFRAEVHRAISVTREGRP